MKYVRFVNSETFEIYDFPRDKYPDFESIERWMGENLSIREMDHFVFGYTWNDEAE